MYQCPRWIVYSRCHPRLAPSAHDIGQALAKRRRCHYSTATRSAGLKCRPPEAPAGQVHPGAYKNPAGLMEPGGVVRFRFSQSVMPGGGGGAIHSPIPNPESDPGEAPGTKKLRTEIDSIEKQLR